MNIQKTKIMLSSTARKRVVTIENQTLGVVEEYLNLGQLLKEEPTHIKEIHCRINMGWCVYGRHSQFMNGNLSLSLKWKLHNY